MNAPSAQSPAQGDVLAVPLANGKFGAIALTESGCEFRFVVLDGFWERVSRAPHRRFRGVSFDDPAGKPFGRSDRRPSLTGTFTRTNLEKTMRKLAAELTR